MAAPLRAKVHVDDVTTHVDLSGLTGECDLCSVNARTSDPFMLPSGAQALVVSGGCDTHRTRRMHAVDDRGEVIVSMRDFLTSQAVHAAPRHFAMVVARAVVDPAPELATLDLFLELARAQARIGVVPTANHAATHDALYWALSGWTAEQRAAGEAIGMTGEDAYAWSYEEGREDFTVEEAMAWHQVCGGDREPTWWLHLAGVSHPDARPAGLNPSETVLLRAAGLPVSAEWSFWPHGLCPDYAHEAGTWGHAPRDVITVGRLLAASAAVTGHPLCDHAVNDTVVSCGWRYGAGAHALERARPWAGLDWSVLANALLAGMSPDDAAEYVRSGGDPAAVALLAGLTG